MIYNCSTVLVFLNWIFQGHELSTIYDSLLETPKLWCHQWWVVKWISQLQFRYHPLRMQKGSSKIFGSKMWVVELFHIIFQEKDWQKKEKKSRVYGVRLEENQLFLANMETELFKWKKRKVMTCIFKLEPSNNAKYHVNQIKLVNVQHK